MLVLPFLADGLGRRESQRMPLRILMAITATLVLVGLSTACQGRLGGITLPRIEANAGQPVASSAATGTNTRQGRPTVDPPEKTAVSQGTPSRPTAAATPPAPSGVPKGEIEAASRVIPVPKVNLPKGPRKPPPTRLIIPSIGVDTKVIELGTRYNEQGELVWETAPFAAGHHLGTANPGEQGNVVISGHIGSVREGDVFKRLPEISIGDGVVVATNDRNYLYRVSDKNVVEPTQVEVMGSTGEEILTLITCVPDGVYTQRLVVTAKRL